MAKIYVSEFAGLANTDQSDSVAILAIPASASYTVVVSGGVSVAATPIQPTTRFIEISTDTTASFTLGTSGGVCALTDCRLSIGERIIRRVPGGYPLPSTHNQPAGLAASLFVLTTANA